MVSLTQGSSELHFAMSPSLNSFLAMFDCPRTTFDKENDQVCQDLTTTPGLFSLIKKCLRLKPGALLWLANPCHMHVWMSSSVHQRGPDQPWGDVSKPSNLTHTTLYTCLYVRTASKLYPQSPGVRISNCITARVCLMLFIATCRGVWTAIEQPVSSTLKWVPHFVHLRNLLLACDGELWKYCSLWLGSR